VSPALLALDQKADVSLGSSIESNQQEVRIAHDSLASGRIMQDRSTRKLRRAHVPNLQTGFQVSGTRSEHIMNRVHWLIPDMWLKVVESVREYSFNEIRLSFQS
jgi:hypothetical protein